MDYIAMLLQNPDSEYSVVPFGFHMQDTPALSEFWKDSVSARSRQKGQDGNIL